MVEVPIGGAVWDNCDVRSAILIGRVLYEGLPLACRDHGLLQEFGHLPELAAAHGDQHYHCRKRRQSEQGPLVESADSGTFDNTVPADECQKSQ